jgi:hypothetical protein
LLARLFRYAPPVTRHKDAFVRLQQKGRVVFTAPIAGQAYARHDTPDGWVSAAQVGGIISGFGSSAARRQCAICPAPNDLTGGGASAQAATASAQRGAKLQPCGSDARLGGAPGIVVNRLPGFA